MNTSKTPFRFVPTSPSRLLTALLQQRRIDTLEARVLALELMLFTLNQRLKHETDPIEPYK